MDCNGNLVFKQKSCASCEPRLDISQGFVLDTHCLTAKVPQVFVCTSKSGEMSEWPNEHAWKACVQQCTEGSNPSLSAIFHIAVETLPLELNSN